MLDLRATPPRRARGTLAGSDKLACVIATTKHLRLLLVVTAIGCAPAERPGAADGTRGEASRPADAAQTDGVASARIDVPADPIGPVLQAAIDAPQLDPYWHVAERADRSPLVLVRFPALQGEPPLVKFGKPVEYATHADAASRPHIEVQAISIKPDRAMLVLGYPVEGVVAHVSLVRENGAWIVAKAEVVEH